MGAACSRWLKLWLRKKTFTEDQLRTTNLLRCLSTLDLVGLGVGGTMGATTYILTGQVAMETAGPAVVLCFLVSSLVAALSGLCYAEFATRVPRAGSCFEYSYITLGELVAFCVGWDLVLEKSASVALMARSLSSYLDYATGQRMQRFFQRVFPLRVTGLSPYADLFAMATVVLLTGVVALGLKVSTKVSSLVCGINMIVLSLVIVVGFCRVDLHNWNLSEDEIPANVTAGSGGFLPFGLSGVWSGSAICFSAFIGFETVATMGEEAENPRRAIPVSLMVTLMIVVIYNVGVATVVTLMCPYYLVDPSAPLAAVFDYVGLSGMRNLISVGAPCGILGSLIALMHPSSRAVYAMALDGLVFRGLAYVHPRFKTPLTATVLMGALAGVWAPLLTISDLLYMVDVGTLVTQAVLAVGIMLLRYQTEDVVTATSPGDNTSCYHSYGSIEKTPDRKHTRFKLNDLINPPSRTPTAATSSIANWCIMLMCLSLTGLCIFITACGTRLTAGTGWCVAVVATLGLLTVICLLVLARQPHNQYAQLFFRVPCVPVIPALSFLVNIYLVCGMRLITWLRLIAWMVIGICVYYFYGHRYSRLHVASEAK